MRRAAFALGLALAGCGGAQTEARIDWRARLRDGRAADVVREIEAEVASRPDDAELRRVLFLAHAAAWAEETPPHERLRPAPERARRAGDALDVAARIEGGGVALRRALWDAPAAGLERTRTGHVAVTGLALAWVTDRFAPSLSPDDPATRPQAVQAGLGLLELVAAAAEAGVGDEEALRGPLDAGSALLDMGSDGLRFGEDRASAWAAYLASARAAVALASAEHPPRSGADVLVVAIVTVERNDAIALPVECDLASPIADLRRVAGRDLDLIGRLETALRFVHGCVPDTYLPPPTR